MACCIATYTLVVHEYSFDAFHSKSDRIYRIVAQFQGTEGKSFQGYTEFPMATALRNDFPDLPLVTQVVTEKEAIVKITDAINSPKFEENDITYADEYFLQTFDYSLLAGQSETLLATPDEVVLTQELADKFFGKSSSHDYEALLGKTLLIDQLPFRVSGIIQDVPRNTNVTFRMLLPILAFKNDNAWVIDNWNSTNSEWYTFVTLPKEANATEWEAQMEPFKHKYLSEEQADKKTYHLQPLSEIHTDERYGGTVYAAPKILIIAFVSMGLIVLIAACINFINLATAQSVQRAKEIGIRKTLGSLRSQLIVQFMSETLLLTLLAAGAALFIAERFVEAFNRYLSGIIDFGLTINPNTVYFLLALCLLVTLLAGYYPAKILAGFRPVEALRQSLNQKNAGFAGTFSLRKTLVVTQFVISQLLIIGTIIVALQMHYVHTRDLGFNQDDIAMVTVPVNDPQKLATFRDQVTRHAAVSRVSFCSGPPLSRGQSWTSTYNPQQGDTEKYRVERKYVDPEYLETFGIPLLAGRNLREEDQVSFDDSLLTYNTLLNETAVQTLGFASPEEAVGRTVVTDGDKKATVVGVVRDFNNAPLQEDIHACMLFYGTNWVSFAAIRLTEEQPVHQLAFVQEAWEDTYPDYFYLALSMKDYFDYTALYVIENIMYEAFKIFAFLSIMIGCLGLYGLVSYLSLQRQKEIGVRKVLGATVQQIIYLFSKEFTLLVLLAFVVAAPLGYFAMQAWLETFTYRISLSISYFLVALLASVGIAWLTVGYKSVRAALSNPVEALRNE